MSHRAKRFFFQCNGFSDGPRCCFSFFFCFLSLVKNPSQQPRPRPPFFSFPKERKSHNPASTPPVHFKKKNAKKCKNKTQNSIDEKIKKLDAQLVGHREAIRKARPGPAQEAAKRRALAVLKQKKMLESQRDQLYNQQFNMEQTSFALESVKDSVATVQAMKAAGTELKRAMKDKNLDLGAIEDLQDDMADLMDSHAEIQEALGQTFGLPDDVDEDELLGELDALEDELAAEASAETAAGEGASAAPSYLSEEPTDLPAAPAQRVAVGSGSGGGASAVAQRN